MTEPEQIAESVADPVMEMKRAVVAIGLELPAPVWEDVRAKWNAVAAEVRRLRALTDGLESVE